MKRRGKRRISYQKYVIHFLQGKVYHISVSDGIIHPLIYSYGARLDLFFNN